MEEKMGLNEGLNQKENNEVSNEIVVQSIDRISTRGDGQVEKTGNFFEKNAIQWESSMSHLKIHHGNEVPGSQFNGEVFENPEAVKEFLIENLDQNIEYDQHGRVELTLNLKTPDNKPVGWTGVASVNKLKAMGAEVVKENRMKGGVKGKLDNEEGMWFPEMKFDSNLKKMVEIEGGKKEAKFEPKANIAYVSGEQFRKMGATQKLTLIIQKDNKTGLPNVLTIFPGDNAPAYPAKVDTDSFKANTLKRDSNERKFWNEHAFLKVGD